MHRPVPWGFAHVSREKIAVPPEPLKSVSNDQEPHAWAGAMYEPFSGRARPPAGKYGRHAMLALRHWRICPVP